MGSTLNPTPRARRAPGAWPRASPAREHGKPGRIATCCRRRPLPFPQPPQGLLRVVRGRTRQSPGVVRDLLAQPAFEHGGVLLHHQQP